MSKPSVVPPGGRRKKKMSGADLFHGADDKVDEYTQATWTKTARAGRARADKDSSDPPQPPPAHENNEKESKAVEATKNKTKASNNDKELLYQQLNNRSKKRNMKRQKHVKSNSATDNIKKRSKWWRSRNSDAKEAIASSASSSTKQTNATKQNKNIIIKINHINKDKIKNKSQKHGKHKKHKHQNVTFNVEPEQQILGDILIHCSSWNHLMSKNKTQKSVTTQKLLGVGWKKIYSVLDRETLCFWDNPSSTKEDELNIKNTAQRNTAHITIYFSEILTLSKSIRTIDGEKYIIELNVDGMKCLLSFANIEQREYWHSLLSDYHLNYFVWRSTPLDEAHRRSQNVIHGVYKLLKSQKHSIKTEDNVNADTLNILYIEEILQKISDLNITKIIDIVPRECKFMSGRLIRVIMSIKFFFMSVLKSLSGADIPLPSRDLLMSYLDEIDDIEWEETSREVLDFYCDKCYRIMFHLSFAFTSNARDEIMKLNEYIDFKKKRQQKKAAQLQQSQGQQLQDTFEDERKIAEMKFEYESLQRSWKMHRDRLQEYVMAYRDAVAKLKHSYHQRDSLCKKIETLQSENKQMNESMRIQNKTYNRTIAEAQKLTQKFAILSQQMENAQNAQNQIIDNLNNKKKLSVINNGQYSSAAAPQTIAPPQYPLPQQRNKKNHASPSHQIHQISQDMTALFNGLNHMEHDNNKYTWI